MPARVNKIRHDENTRAKIQAGNIITRLQNLIDGKIEMAPHAVSAALGLLRKTLPDLASVEVSGEIATSKVIRSPAPSATPSTWAKDHIPPHLRPTEH